MIIEIEKSNMMEISENIEKGLRYMGKAMQAVDEICQGGDMGYRGGGYPSNSPSYQNTPYMGYRTGMGYREEEPPMYDEYGNIIHPKEMGMRRMRDSRGRYM